MPDKSLLDTVQASILNIDAWRDAEGWWWNNWWKIGNISVTDLEKCNTPRKLFTWLRKEGFLTLDSAGKLRLEDDQHNFVVVRKRDGMPLLAIEYAPVYERADVSSLILMKEPQ
jgi:hypothetical protein